MRAGKLTLFAAFLAVLACPLVASADITSAFDLTGKLNTVDFRNREVFMRDVNGQYQVINPASGLLSGDLLVSVFRGQDLTILGSNTPAWTGGPGDYFEGYSVQQVVVSTPAFTYYTNPTADPFGKLNTAAGETVKLYVDTASDWKVDNATIAQGVASVTDGVGIASFTIASGGDYAYFTPQGPEDGTGYFGLTPVMSPPGVTFVPYSPSTLTPTDISSKVTVGANQSGPIKLGGAATSEWYFESYGPMYFKAVPEPASVAMWLGFLTIGAVVALRRRKK